jgi:hypothetical protein
LGKDLDQKYSALSTSIYKKSRSDGTYPGSILFTDLQLAVGGSHLHSRINAVIEASSLRMDRVGGEQSTYNKWKNSWDLYQSLGMSADMIMKIILIHAIGHVREHQSTIVALASLSPDELREISPQDILQRFLSSAEHAKGLRGQNQKDLALYSNANEVPRADANGTVCYNCGKLGHISPRCPNAKKKRPAAGDHVVTKKFKKI